MLLIAHSIYNSGISEDWHNGPVAPALFYELTITLNKERVRRDLLQRRAIWVTAREIIELRERHRREITEALGSNTYALPSLDYLYERPIVSVRTVQQRLDCAFATANKLVDQFVELGLLRETTESGVR